MNYILGQLIYGKHVHFLTFKAVILHFRASNVLGLSEEEELQLIWILSTPFHKPVSTKSALTVISSSEILFEIGPR